jgi:hypothetical protein
MGDTINSTSSLALFSSCEINGTEFTCSVALEKCIFVAGHSQCHVPGLAKRNLISGREI